MERLKGLTIEMDLDTMKVDSGLTSLRRNMRQVNSEMRSNMSAFDRSDKSIGKYETRLTGLNKKLEAQKVVTESARKHHEKMVAEFGEGSKEADNAAIAYNNQSAQLKNLERYVSRATDELKMMKREQEIQSSGWYKTGDAIEGFSDKLGSVSGKAREVGSSLTKSITLPALGVATAVGGIVAAFGWQRLVGLDTAKAQLEGLGYSTEDVGRITDQVTSAIEGGMTTMAEGTAIAAGAMAAGVKEGAELEKYIKLVGDAAVGSNRPVDEMAQIFNRVQGGGRLMTQELNMIEQGMPGFAQAMSDELADGSLEAFRDMVTNGEVGSDDFLKVMDGFAGGMAAAYSESWGGMVENTKAYIGIIGENLLGGVFEKSKESIAEFIELLSSEDTIEWAERTGEAIGEAFSGMVDRVQSVVGWFSKLDTEKQKLIGKLGLFAVAIGPLLWGFGILGGLVSKLLKPIGFLFKFIARGGGLFKALGLAIGAISAPVAITIGIIAALAGGFTLAYKKSETFRELIHKLGEKFKEVFENILEFIQPGIDAVIGFFDDTKEKITGFINEEGEQLMEAFGNIGSFISTVAGIIFKAVKWAFDGIMSVVEFVMPFILGIIEMVWGNIKGIITGTLDIIMGAVKVFSGLFTGDFAKMWEGVKQMFFGAIKVIWNWIQLQFIGRILKGVGGLAKGFSGHIRNLWTWVKELFTKSITSVYNSVKTSFVGRIIGSIVNFVKTFRSRISNMWTSLKSTFSSYITSIRESIANSFVGRILSSVGRMKTRFVDIAKDMWTGVRNQFTNMVEGAKALPGRIGRGIGSMASKVTSGVKKVTNKLASTLGKGVNGVIGGVNWVLGKIGVKSKIPKWDVPKYARGTGSHPGGLAYVGDGTGRLKGSEYIETPDGKGHLSPDRTTLMNLPRGSKVMPADKTREMLNIPAYANGIGKLANRNNAASQFKRNKKYKAPNVWDYLTKPKLLLNKALRYLGVETPKGASFIPQMAKGGFNKVKEAAISKIKGETEDLDVAGPSSGGAKAWRNTIKTAAARMNETLGKGHMSRIISQIDRESGGNQRIVQSSALLDVNTLSGNPARGLLQYIPQTFDAYKMKGNGNIYSGYDQLLAFFNNKTWRSDLPSSPRGWGPRGGRKYATGGLIMNEQLATLGEEGQEMVIPLAKNRRTDAMKLLAITGKMLGEDEGGGKARLPHQLSNVSGGSGGNQQMNDLLQATLKQNEILMKILNKNQDLYMEEHVVGKILSPIIDDNLDRDRRRVDKFRG